MLLFKVCSNTKKLEVILQVRRWVMSRLEYKKQLKKAKHKKIYRKGKMIFIKLAHLIKIIYLFLSAIN